MQKAAHVGAFGEICVKYKIMIGDVIHFSYFTNT